MTQHPIKNDVERASNEILKKQCEGYRIANGVVTCTCGTVVELTGRPQDLTIDELSSIWTAHVHAVVMAELSRVTK